MRFTAVALLTLAVLAGCGESGSNPVRPAEAHFRALAATDTPFRVLGFLTSNGPPHLFDPPGREFAGPYSFYFINAKRPLSGTFTSDEDALEDARVLLLFPADEANGTVTDETTLPAGSSDPQVVSSKDGVPQPVDTAREVRIEVVEADNAIDVPFSSTIGDDFSTYLACGNAEVCGTPAVFYFERAQDKVSAIFSKLVRDDRVLLVSLYVDGQLRDTAQATTNDPNAQVSFDF